MSNIFIQPAVTIIGAGAYGTAIAVALARSGIAVKLWGHNPEHIHSLKQQRSNSVNLPNISFPPLLYLEKSLSIALNTCQNILIAVPSHVFSTMLMQLKPYITNNIRVIIASKGLEPKTSQFLQNVTHDILGNHIPCAIISGPTFARELAIGLPTAITLASTDLQFSDDVQNLLYYIRNLKIYKTTDIIGTQIAGAVKNIIAIGVGISDGVGFGANARTALITRGLAEMSRLGIAMGSTQDIFVGLAGLGDLVLTCTDDQSRNRRFGILLGQGMDKNLAKKNIGQIIEGLYSTKAVYRLSIKYKVRMPITEQIYHILYSTKSINEAIDSLLQRTDTKDMMTI